MEKGAVASYSGTSGISLTKKTLAAGWGQINMILPMAVSMGTTVSTGLPYK
jgi:hypothetical protein